MRLPHSVKVPCLALLAECTLRAVERGMMPLTIQNCSVADASASPVCVLQKVHVSGHIRVFCFVPTVRFGVPAVGLFVRASAES